MATLTVTKKYTSGDQWASLVFTLTYSVSNTDPVTSELTPSSLKITTGQSTASTTTQENNLTYAKIMRGAALNDGVAYSVVYNGSTIANTTTHTTGSQSISTTARNVSKTHATQTKTLTLTGAGVSKSASVSIPAKTSYKVTLNANGGTGGTASLTKWHGETLSLTSGFTAPTRTGYKFVGWGETSTAPATASQYTGNAAKTYYAVWERQITGISLNVTTLRVADGTATAEADDGTWCYGTCTYSITGTAAADVVFTVSVTPNTPQITQDTFTATKTEDNTLTGSFEFWASDCSTDASYTFMVSAVAENTSAAQTVTKAQGNVLSMAYFVMDVLGNGYTGQRPGHGISFGEPCKNEGFHVGMKPYFGKYPVEDTNDEYALIIGNGTSDTARSNAFAVKWDGTVETDQDIPWTNLPIASGWSAYNAARTPKYRRVGSLVEIRGAVKPNTSTQLGYNSVTFANLPQGCRPTNTEVAKVCQGSGVKVWMLTVDSDGNVGASRMRTMDSTSYQNVGTSEFMIFDVMFFAG